MRHLSKNLQVRKQKMKHGEEPDHISADIIVCNVFTEYFTTECFFYKNSAEIISPANCE